MLYIILQRSVCTIIIDDVHIINISYIYISETLEKLRTNVALNQVKNFNILQQQQEYLINWRNEEFETFYRLKESISQVLNGIDTVQQGHSRTANQIQHIFEALVLLQNQTEVILQRYSRLIQYNVNRMQNQLNQLAIRQELELDRVINTVVKGLKIVDKNIEKILYIQEKTIKSRSHAKVNIFTYL